MMSPARKRRRLLGAIASLSATTLVVGFFFTPAQASPDNDDLAVVITPEQAEMIRLYDHPMGSQIRKHEGTANMPRGAAAPDVGAQASVPGIDVSGWQGNVDWNYWWNQGKRFVWVKATEGTYYTNPYFTQQYNGSYNRGFIRGAYHFARPDTTSGATQANYFSSHGGGWSGDGKTLPGALDLEYNPYGSDCYGLSKAQMTRWILDFSNTYHARWDKWPAIYTSTSWWSLCVGNSDFSSTNPLWVARYSSTVGPLPYNWSFYTVWQYSSSPIDQNTFNGSYDRLVVFARTHD